MSITIINDELAAAAAEAEANSGLMARWAVLAELGMLAGAGDLPSPARISFQGDNDGQTPILSLQFDSPDQALAWLNWFGQAVDDRPIGSHTRSVSNRHNFVWRGWTVQVHGWA